MKLTRRGLFGVTLGALAAPLAAKLTPSGRTPAVAPRTATRAVELGDWCMHGGRYMVVTKIDEGSRGSVLTLETDFRSENGSLARLTTLVNSRDVTPFTHVDHLGMVRSVRG